MLYYYKNHYYYFTLWRLDVLALQVDLTEYVEKHGFVFDAVMNEDVTNDEVGV